MRYLCITLGTIFVILGAIGLLIPLLPTTPFLLLAAALYISSSEKLYLWLINQRMLGPYIRIFMETKAIPLRGKIVSTTMMWCAMGYCIIIVQPLWLKITIAITAIGVTAYILSFKTLKSNKNQNG